MKLKSIDTQSLSFIYTSAINQKTLKIRFVEFLFFTIMLSFFEH